MADGEPSAKRNKATTLTQRVAVRKLIDPKKNNSRKLKVALVAAGLKAEGHEQRQCLTGFKNGVEAIVKKYHLSLLSFDAMRLLKQAWDAVTTETIVKKKKICSRKAHCLHEIFVETEIVADELDAALLYAVKKLQIAAAVIEADDSAMDIVGDVMETSGTLSIASASNEKLVSASTRYLDIEESSEVKDLLVQDYVDELQQIEEEDEEENVTVQSQTSRDQSKAALHLQALSLVDWRKIGVSSEILSSAELANFQDALLTVKAPVEAGSPVEAASEGSCGPKGTRKIKQMSLHDYHE